MGLQYARKEKSLQQQEETTDIVVKNKILLSSHTGESFLRGYLLISYFFRFPLKHSSFTAHKLISTFWALLHYKRDINSVLQK